LLLELNRKNTMQTKYSKDHEYIRVENGTGTIGITSHAQEKLGDVTYVETPQIGKIVQQSEQVGVVESVKAASEIYSPVSGEVIEVNAALKDKPELVNEDAEGAGWFFKVVLADPSELDVLMDKDSYLNYVAEHA
jgi:glycine cleavage system H protein